MTALLLALAITAAAAAILFALLITLVFVAFAMIKATGAARRWASK